MPRRITEYLLEEHQELSQLLNELADELRTLPFARNARTAFERLDGVCQEISATLHTHLEEEEQVLYPKLEAHVQGISRTLDRMRHDHEAGEAVEKAFLECIGRLAKGEKNRGDVVRSGRSYIQWVRGHLLNENGRLFPLVERRLDPETQQEIRRAMEELSHKTSARIAESFPSEPQA